MPVPKGHRYGGRQKGTPNANTTLALRLAHLGLDPVDVAVKIIQKKETSDVDKLQACFRLIDKLYATPKAIEVTGVNQSPTVHITLVEALAMARGVILNADQSKQIQ